MTLNAGKDPLFLIHMKCNFVWQLESMRDWLAGYIRLWP